MRKFTEIMRHIKTELLHYPAFYALAGIGCPVLYALLLWLDNWGALY